MAMHAPITGALSRALAIHRIEAQVALANRRAIEDEIGRLFALLDAADGDPDRECEDQAVDDGECDEERSAVLPIFPRYSVDQSLGPVNEQNGMRAYYRELQCSEFRA